MAELHRNNAEPVPEPVVEAALLAFWGQQGPPWHPDDVVQMGDVLAPVYTAGIEEGMERATASYIDYLAERGLQP